MDRLTEIRARLDAATTLPVSPHSVTLFPIDRRRDEIAERAFIAHAPADIAWLLDEVDRLRGAKRGRNARLVDWPAEQVVDFPSDDPARFDS